MTVDRFARLSAVLAAHQRIAVAVSGGVDSMTMAHAVKRILGRVEAVHAVSPAVPRAATDRVRDHAERQGWALTLVDAGEFADPDYRRNPLNRCYFCKSNLYARIADVADVTGATIAAGTNTDDLADFRPGLTAADEAHVVHPFVEAGMAKADVRALARRFGITDVAELPAQPCLASRVQTGIPIAADDLRFIERVERHATQLLGPGDIRCRITPDGVHLELGATAGRDRIADLDAWIRAVCATSGRPYRGCRPYRRGSAFVAETA